jgi:hypothetical protein
VGQRIGCRGHLASLSRDRAWNHASSFAL